MDPLRVLQVLSDTDDADDARFALDLHARLAERGLQVRTMALGPGRRGGLEARVPVMSPSRRSIAAHTQLRREQRWADVVVLRGEGPVMTAGLSRIGDAPPTVVALGDETRRWARHPVPARARRLVDRGVAALVVTDEPAAAAVAAALGRRPHDLAVIPYGVDVRPPVTSVAARQVARRMLGLPADGVIARFVGGPAADDGAGVAEGAAARAGVPFVGPGDGEADVVAAAADVALLPTGRTWGPPRGLLLAARGGAALVAPAAGGLAVLVDDATGVVCPPDEASVAAALEALAADPDHTVAAGAAARERVRDRFDLDVVSERWSDLLAQVAALRS